MSARASRGRMRTRPRGGARARRELRDRVGDRRGAACATSACEVVLAGRDEAALARGRGASARAAAMRVEPLELDADADRAARRGARTGLRAARRGRPGDPRGRRARQRGGLPEVQDIPGARRGAARSTSVGAGSLLLHTARAAARAGAAARSSCSRRWRRSGRVRRTPSTAPRRPASTRSRRRSPMTLHGSGVRVMVVRPGLRAHAHDGRPARAAARDDARGGRARDGAGPRAPRGHGLGSGAHALGDGAAAPAATFAVQEAPRLSQRAPIQTERPRPLDAGRDPVGPSPVQRQRRAQSLRVRRRRLLVADIGLGIGLAILGLLLAPGLAYVALGALVVLVGCCVSLVVGGVRRRRRARRTSGHR